MSDMPNNRQPDDIWLQYKKARESEWVIKDGNQAVDEATAQLTRALPAAIQRILWIAQNAEPRLSFEANKYIVERVMGKPEKPVNSKLEDLVKQLSKND
jgi:hypothetical protein